MSHQDTETTSFVYLIWQCHNF